MPDHIHMLIRLRPAMAPAKLVQLVKQNSSKWINENSLCPVKFNWQRGGGVFSVSRHDVGMISGYIDKQKRHHKDK